MGTTSNISKYEFAFAYMIRNEGGYTNHPLDHGGCTNWGITLKALWKDPYMGHIQTCQDLKEMSLRDAKLFYYRSYWRYGLVEDWRVATKLFDIFVNLPPASANRIFQRAANACGAVLKVDGIFGSQTLKAINKATARDYLEELIDQLHTYYEKIVEATPSQAVFLKGWLTRCHRLPPEPPQQEED